MSLFQHSILERYKRGETANLLELHNKTPVWNDDTQSYVLNFHGRVTQVNTRLAFYNYYTVIVYSSLAL